ncbi:uncharacterized protein LOC110440384 [Mizuhopecten yessoensis]|uniref:Uncharacterized protein n=1 Tax=Mizuhopecten yessoensis TaxID=6573 RepID=A0A210PLA9_MIZYE|nr:uncharacterized protein LOC110440384 [Mizuhopecten yessoensis]OWF37265.1 hypothetical protein KP79_PYT12710 [Mizuhopecten yessoensis]
MAAERQSLPDLRSFLPGRGSKEDKRFYMTTSMSCNNITKEKAEDDTVENLDNGFDNQVKQKTKKKRSGKSKRNINGNESPRAEGKKEKVSLKKRFKRLLTPKRIKNSYNLPTPQVAVSLNVNESEASNTFFDRNNEDFKKHGTIYVQPVCEETDTTERICDCERVKQLEREILQLKNEKSTKEREMLNTIEKQDEVISEMTRALTELVQDVRYVKLSGCQNIQVCAGGYDPKELLEPVRSILEGLCKNNEEVKRIAMDISERVNDMQNSSTEDRSQQKNDIMQLQQLVEQMISKTQDDLSENPPVPVLQLKCSKPRDSVYSSQHSLVDSGNCVVWGRSDIINDVSGRQHDIQKCLMKIQERLENVEINSEKCSTFFELFSQIKSILVDSGKDYERQSSKLTGKKSF